MKHDANYEISSGTGGVCRYAVDPFARIIHRCHRKWVSERKSRRKNIYRYIWFQKSGALVITIVRWNSWGTVAVAANANEYLVVCIFNYMPLIWTVYSDTCSSNNPLHLEYLSGGSSGNRWSSFGKRLQTHKQRVVVWTVQNRVLFLIQ